jgi:hypothetical protein
MTEPPEPITTTVAEAADTALVEACHAERARQADRLDDLAKELFKLELAIPGLYAAALRLLEGKAQGLPAVTVWLAFAFWLTALGLTLWGLFPRRWRVQCDAVDRPPGETVSEPLTAGELFEAAARFKYRRLVAAAIAFFAGVVCAAAAMLH